MPEYETTAIGLAGTSCSGKTTLICEIVRRSPREITTLSFDRYWKDIIPNLKRDELPDWESPESYDIARFLRDLQLLKRREIITTQSNLVLVEGFLIYHSPVARACFNKKIFIDLPEEEVIRRRSTRPRSTFGVDDEREYVFKMLLPGLQRWVYPQRQYADLVLDGLRPVDVLAEEVIKFLG